MSASKPPLTGWVGNAPPPLKTRQAKRLRRSDVVFWLRRTHGWFGLWGATLGLLFGFSGIWLNHRAVLKLPPVAQQRSTVQIALPDPLPADSQALATWLQAALKLDRPPNTIKVEPAQRVAWAEPEPGRVPGAGTTGIAHDAMPLMQPAHWTIMFGGPNANLQVEAWAGNRSVSVRRVDQGVLGTLMNLHKGVGMPVAWILLVYTLAGSLILLSVSGLALWVMTHRHRAVGLAIFGSSVALVLGVVASRL